MKKKVFILLPDGGGLRNFVFSSFKRIGEENGFDLVYWNNKVLPLKKMYNYEEVIIPSLPVHPFTLLISKARKDIELNLSKIRFEDEVYETYKFPLSFIGLKNCIKSILVWLLIKLFSSESGLLKIKQSITYFERKTQKYLECKKQLEQNRPDLVFCTNQRNTQNISPILAATDLGIPTVCFIQSWDNVPKAMLVIETDYYFVWSHLMKKELLAHYPFIKYEQVFVTGTPQFEPHYDNNLAMPRDLFFKENNLDIETRYICFSGDDETTSPLDQLYLEDLATVIRSLNAKGENLGIIYRKCPVDFTTRYDEVINANLDVIRVVNPLWSQNKVSGEIVPTEEDARMLYNVCEHSEMVTNVCSSTIFDFVLHSKACIYYNYEQPQLKKGIRDIGQNYNYVHFRSMPSKKAVLFCEDKMKLEQLVLDILHRKVSNVDEGQKWFEIVAGTTPEKTSAVIWEVIANILS